MQSKYNNRKVRFLGETFDSMLECERYKYLKALEQQKVISNLQRQVKYVLLSSQKDSKTQKTIERGKLHTLPISFTRKALRRL